MKAMLLTRISSVAENDQPLEMVEIPMPQPGRGEVLIEVSVCGVCHTELDEIEGRTAPPRLPVVPGHEVIGRVVECGPEVVLLKVGDRVGVGWIYSSTGDEQENLSPRFMATGRDVNGGYAEYMTVGEQYAYPIPDIFSDAEAAPLLCAGAVGYRALKLTQLVDGERLGLTGFGGSAHIVIQLAKHLYPKSSVYVFARDQQAREHALELGAVWAGQTTDQAPEQLDAIIDTTPAWKPIVEALRNLAPAGRLVINAIRKEDHDKESLLELSYHDQLWMEREIKTVANVTHFDINEFLQIAAEIPIKPQIVTFPLEEANQAAG
ncbi:MAG: zinc-dependent alcohol dehydrogenase family protein [Planctomycetaceae bacterium]